MDEHTSNTVIAKFTPPDVDAAISNIVDKSSSFLVLIIHQEHGLEVQQQLENL